MRRVEGKIMSGAMISASCANFLSDIGAYPGTIQSGGALNARGHQCIRFVDYSDTWTNASMPIKPPWLLTGSLRRDLFSSRATLNLESKWYRYRESKNGFSTVTLWGIELPATVCAGVAGGRYRLLDLVDLSNFKPIFFARSNPHVHAMKMGVRLRRNPSGMRYGEKPKRARALIITLRDEWSRDNWSFWSPETGYRSTMDNP